MQDSGPVGDAVLVAGCLRGEAAAWEQLVRRYAGLVWALPRKYGLDDDQSADVFQTTWTTFWERLEDVRNHRRVSAWLITVAARLSYQEIERSRRERGGFEGRGRYRTMADPETPIEEQALAQLELADLTRAMAALPDRCRGLLELLFYDPDAPSYAEIAGRLGVSPDSVGPLRGRCLRRLRRLLEGSGR